MSDVYISEPKNKTCDKCGCDYGNNENGLSVSSPALINIVGKSYVDICLSCFVGTFIDLPKKPEAEFNTKQEG